MSHASLCFLSYNRIESLEEAIRTASVRACYPHEIIVHDDGSDVETQRVLHDLLVDGCISRLILNPYGHNEGVGTAFNRAAALATGDPIIKLDQDLRFAADWLRAVTVILANDRTIAGLGLFKYPVWPCRWQDMELDQVVRGGHRYHYVKDFVSSAIAIPRDVWKVHGPWPEHSAAFAEDLEWKTMMREQGYEMALPDADLAQNVGFGVGPSTVALSDGQGGVKVQEIHDGPVILG